MKFRRFLARHSRGFRLLPMSGASGARQRVFMQMCDRPIVPYHGPFEEHALLFVREGSVTFQRDGQSFSAHETDALLIPRGERGRLTLHLDPITSGISVEIMTFDERAISRTLRRDAGLESLVLAHAPSAATALCFRGLERIPSDLPLPTNRFRAALSSTVMRYSPGMLAFLRDHFYQQRWKLLLFLEGLVTSPEALKDAAVQYSGGNAKLGRDCLLYTGTKLEAFLIRRRCELASAWLRCGHSIETVAKALGFSGEWEFECVFAGTMKKRCSDVQKLPLLAQIEPEQLIEALQPFWWKGRELTGARIPQARVYPSSVMDEAMEEEILSNEPELLKSREHDRQRRAEFTQHLREKAVDFFDMKSTGAAIIVPIFNVPAVCTAVAA